MMGEISFRRNFSNRFRLEKIVQLIREAEAGGPYPHGHISFALASAAELAFGL